MFEKRGQRMNYKSQISLFIILGIIILFIFGMLYFFIFKNRAADNISKLEASEDVLLAKEKYNARVKQCVEESAKEGIYLIGIQGGVIYNYQAAGGKQYLGPPNYNYGEYVLPLKDEKGIIQNVSYGIKNSVIDNYHPNIPLYPYGYTRLVSDPKIYDPSYINPFGNSPEPGPFVPLCDYNGENSPKRSKMHFACDSYDATNLYIHNSVQEYLEAYIAAKTEECADFSIYTDIPDNGISKGKAVVNITFSDSYVTVDVSYPINISYKDGASSILLDKHTVSIRSRLKLIHELARHLIDREVNDIFFDMIRDASTLNNCNSNTGGTVLCLKNAMVVSKIVNPCLSMEQCSNGGKYDDIFLISDSTSKFNNKPYIFQFAVENRAPALDLLRQANLDPGLGFDYIVYLGNNLTIDPTGYDPDEEGHNSRGFMSSVYTYSLWKESYNDVYKKIDCNLNAANKDFCKNHPDQAFIQDPLSQPKSFTKSGLYLATGRMTSYRVNESDTGLHKLRVDVCDQEGLCDYQVLSVLVADLNGSTNYFPDLPQTFVSLEDPYLLKYSGFIGSLTPVKYRFEFYNSLGVLYLAENGTGSAQDHLDLPNDSPNISNIKNGDPAAGKKGMTDFFPSSGEYTVKMMACLNDNCSNNIPSVPVLLKVFDCLPHWETITTQMYPINPASGFMVTHGCCKGNPADALTLPLPSGWGTYNGSSDICYKSKPEYGCRIESNYSTTTPFGLSPVINFNPYSFPPLASQYKRTLTVWCSGERGNVCDGNPIDNRTAVADCSGGCKACQYNNTNQDYCSISTGVCSSAWKCTGGQNALNPDPNYELNPTGKFLCQGGCNSGGDCDKSINCNCNISCGAECDIDNLWEWEGTSCKSNCSGMFDSGFVPYNADNDCMFRPASTTICAAPNYGSALPMTIELFNPYDGSLITHDVKAGNPGTNEMIKYSMTTPDTLPVSKCNLLDYCYISSCMNETALNFRGDECGTAGDVAYNPRLTDYVCFSAGPLCDFNARCTSMTSYSLSYPTFTNNINLKTNEHFEDGNDCYYPAGGDYCTADGQWHVIRSPEPSCASPYICHNGAGAVCNTVTGTTPVCTNAGWTCTPACNPGCS
jgi:hypothetical protein